jgi:hypothetical protein
MAHTYHIIVENNPAILYASRGGFPNKILPVLERFVEKFWQERHTLGESSDTPECLVAQITVRLGFEICEDDFSNLRVGVKYKPDAEFLYLVSLDQKISVWVPDDAYRQNPELGISGCHPWPGVPR